MQTRHWPDHGIPCRERNISSWCRRIVAALCITALCGALSACSAPRIDGRAESEHQPSACESAYWAADASTATMNGRHHIIMRYLAAKQAVGQWSEVAATCTQRFAQGTIRSAQAEHVAVTLGTRIGGNDTYRTVSDDSLRQVLGIDLDGATLGAMSLAEDRAGFVMEVLAARDTPGATLSRSDRHKTAGQLLFTASGLSRDPREKVYDIQKILASTDELLLVISTYTQILDLFATICSHHHWDFFRLDGSTEIAQRQTIVNSFNARFTSKRLFLLSARAGGVGLNITGASRVILLEPAWNPAVDAQSIARSWRFGQQRHVFVYRFFLSGTIEEVILQRQLLKKDIAEVAVDHSSVGEGKLSKEELREVFKLKDVPCQTYLLMNGKKAGDGGESEVQSEDAVWREYEGWESICDDPLLKELVRESG